MSKSSAEDVRGVYSVVGAMVLLIIGLILFVPPNDVVVSPSGQIHGNINRIREAVLGERFWEKQLLEVQKDIAWRETQPIVDAAIEADSRRFEAEEDREQEDLYAKHPELRPSLAELQTEKLRALADAIESKDQTRMIEIDRQRSLQRYQIKAVIEKRLAALN
jgi:flagellar biosynthesis GTPase FlhF